MNQDPSNLLDQCVRRIVAERTGHALALEINASLARQRLAFVRDPLVVEELELVIALASPTARPELAGRISAAARRWADRDPARLAALVRAAEALDAGAVPPLGAAPPPAAPQPRKAPALIVDDPDDAPNDAPIVASHPPFAPSERQGRESRGHGPSPSTHREDAVRSGQPGGNRGKIAVAAVALAAVAAVAIAAVMVLGRGKGSETKQATAARTDENGRKETGRKAGEAKPADLGGEIKVDERAFAEQQRLAMIDAPLAGLDHFDSPQALMETQLVALGTGDAALLGRTLAEDAHYWGPDAPDLATGRDAAVAALRDLVPAGVAITVERSSVGQSSDGETAWWIDELTWTVERTGRKPAERRYLVSRVAMRRADRWEVVSTMWAKRASDSKVAAAAAAGLLPAPALLPVTPSGAAGPADMPSAAGPADTLSGAAPVDALRAAWASPEALDAAIAELDGVAALGSASERDEGRAAVQKRYRKLGGRLFVGDGARHALGASGHSGWVAANIELVVSSRDSGDVVVPYRLLAAMTFDEPSQTWRIAMMHASFGGPVPRVPATARPPTAAPGDDVGRHDEPAADPGAADEPASDPGAVLAEVVPLTPNEVRAAFTAIRDTVAACREIVDLPGDPPRALVKITAAVTAEGTVAGVTVEGTWAGTPHATCVEEAVAAVTFRTPGAPQVVRYPFAF